MFRVEGAFRKRRKQRATTLRRLEELRLRRHTPAGSRIPLEKQASLAHIVPHSGFSSPLTVYEGLELGL